MTSTRAIEDTFKSGDAYAFWQDNLSILNIMQLQADFANITNYEEGICEFTLNDEIKQNLEESFPNEETYLLLFTCLIVTLYQYTQELDLCIGYGSQGLPIRIQFQHNTSFNEVLTLLKTSLYAAQDHLLPLDNILNEAIKPENLTNLPNGLPFSVIFHHEENGAPPLSLAHKTYLTLGCHLNADVTRCTMTYNAAMFSQKRIECLSKHLTQCLKVAATMPTIPVANILLTTPEELILAKEYNQPFTLPVNMNETLADILEKVAQEKPEHNAIYLHSRTNTEQGTIPTVGALSYSLLHSISSQFANYLKTLALPANQPVGIVLPRCLVYYPILFGCIKAGHPFIPMEASLDHAELIKFKATFATAIIVNNKTIQLFKNTQPHDQTATFINIDDETVSETISNQPEQYTRPALTPDTPIYHIFTSGSTGTPKAVSIPHSGPVNLLHWQKNRYQHIDDFSLISTAPYSFDASLYDFFLTLGMRGSMHVTSDAHRISPSHIEETINTYDIKFGVFTPDGLRNLDPHCALKNIITTGSTPLESLFKEWSDIDPRRTFENGYGPTENTICSSQNYWHPEILSNLIGKPVDHCQLYVLNPHSLLPCPIGAVGEICIGGPGVALGYLHQDELSHKKFIALDSDPLFPDTTPKRIYRTGDLGCYIQEPDGRLNLRYHGRADKMLKIFGVQVDLGELENILSALPEIKSVVVKPNPTKTGLYAYVVPIDLSISRTDLLHILRNHLKTQTLLTPIAYPRNIIPMTAIPMTPNGKVDETNLPPCPEPSKLENQSSDIEAYLLNLWAEVLNIDWQEIKPLKTYEENGGDSIRLVWLGNRLCEKNNPFVFPKKIVTQLCRLEITFTQFYETLLPHAAHTDKNDPYINRLGKKTSSSAPGYPGIFSHTAPEGANPFKNEPNSERRLSK